MSLVYRHAARLSLVLACLLIGLVGCSDEPEVSQDGDKTKIEESEQITSSSDIDPPIAVRVVPKGERFMCKPTHVWDGDGPIWCEEGPRVRLAGVAAREMDETCNPGHPCPVASAIEARDSLVDLVGQPIGNGPHGHVLVDGPSLDCVSTGGAGGKRTGAWCHSEANGDLSCAMIRNGSALRWDKYWEEGHC